MDFWHLKLNRYVSFGNIIRGSLMSSVCLIIEFIFNAKDNLNLYITFLSQSILVLVS
jgi:hypothetical protein